MIWRWPTILRYIRTFLHYIAGIREVIILHLSVLTLGAYVIAKAERLSFSSSLYFAFITGLTIGYGDIAPKTALGRLVSIAIGLSGTLFVGLTVAIATQALRVTVRETTGPSSSDKPSP